MRKENYHLASIIVYILFFQCMLSIFVMKLCSGATSKYMQSVANYFGKPQSTYQCLYLFLNRCGL